MDRAGKKILWPSGREYMEAGFLAFWLRFGSVTGTCGHAPSPKPRQNAKNPRSEWLQYFLTRSSPGQRPGFDAEIVHRPEWAEQSQSARRLAHSKTLARGSAYLIEFDFARGMAGNTA
jgi:hypothetical protein